MEKFIVSRDDNIYEAWPDVVLTDAGTLICIFTECAHHGNRDQSRLVWTESADRGRTWSEKHVLTETGTASSHYNCARISRLSDGRLCIVGDYIDSSNENETRKTHNDLWFSSDHGKTWEGPVATPVVGIVPDRVVELQSGRWVLAAHHPHPETGKLTVYNWYSDDQGKTWSDMITLAEDARYNLCEAALVEVEPNVIVAYLRENSGMGWDCFKAISKDGGETWEGVYNVPLPGCHRPTAGLLQDGRMLITYRFIQGGQPGWGNTTQNVMGALMSPASALATNRKEQMARIFPLDYDRSSLADLGYTGWVQFDDGEIYVVNYIVDDAPKAHIRGYSFRAEELFIETPKNF